VNVRRWWGLALRRGGAVGDHVAHRLYESPGERSARPWFARDGDTTLRLDYPLERGSLVFDVGGFKGQWASDIYGRFACRVVVFEPVPEFAAGICRRFEMNPDIEVFAFGLGGQTRDAALWVRGDNSSLFGHGAGATSVRLVSAAEFFREQALREVDLMKINTEGGEYELLDHLIATGLIARIANLQVQFHDAIPDATALRDAIHSRLRVTHECRWCYPCIWESWSRRS